MGRGSLYLFPSRPRGPQFTVTLGLPLSLLSRTSLSCKHHRYLVGVRKFRRTLVPLRGLGQLGGILEACGNTLQWPVRVVEGLVQ